MNKKYVVDSISYKTVRCLPYDPNVPLAGVD